MCSGTFNSSLQLRSNNFGLKQLSAIVKSFINIKALEYKAVLKFRK